MKKVIINFILFISIVFFSSLTKSIESPPPTNIVWGSKNINKPQKITILDSLIQGASNQSLIIDGFVDITHVKDTNDVTNINAISPEEIRVIFDNIIFKPNSRITSKSNLIIISNKWIEGIVDVKNTRGVKGKDGENGQNNESKASNGVDKGESVRGANSGCTNSAQNGNPGDKGGNGNHGKNGGAGSHGKNGSSSGNIFIQMNEIHPNTTFIVDASGGNGGNGGNGGLGQDGGDGGKGGKGGKGGEGSCTGRDGANGGNGGNGGDGGNGGNGGSGGDGGDGGDGGFIKFFTSNNITMMRFNASVDVIKHKVSGGKGGKPGIGGDGGNGGKGGEFGIGGDAGGTSWTSIIGGSGNPGSSGQNGVNGRKGEPGPNGIFGNDGRKGEVHFPQVILSTAIVRTENRLQILPKSNHFVGKFTKN